jgi:hypothetical protein
MAQGRRNQKAHHVSKREQAMVGDGHAMGVHIAGIIDEIACNSSTYLLRWPISD